MIIEHEITLDASRYGTQANVSIAQHDANVHRLIFHVRNGGQQIQLSEEYSAVLYVGDGKDNYEDCTVYTSSGAYANCIVCDLGANVSITHGEYRAVLQIFRNASTPWSSTEIILSVREDITNGSLVLDSPPYAAVIKAQDAAEEYALQAEQAKNDTEGMLDTKLDRSLASYEPTPGNIPQWTSDGTLRGNEPVSDSDLAPKSYIDKRENVINGNIATAKSEANTYTDNVVKSHDASNKNYVDTKVSESESLLKTYTDTKVFESESSLKTYADNKTDAAKADMASYTDIAVAGIVNSAPETLDTLQELSKALGDDPNFATTVSTELGKKATKEELSSGLTENTAQSTNYTNKTHYGYSGDDLLIIPEGTITIDYSNGYEGSAYKCIVLPDSVVHINYGAFQNCGSLKEIIFGNGLEYIGDSAFASCFELTTITIPDSVTDIDISAFVSCTELTSITIGSGVTHIGVNAFAGCYALKSITIPNNVRNIDGYAFEDCQINILDLTAFTTESFPTIQASLGIITSDNFQIKVVKGRKAELASMTNWSAYADHIVEVPTVETVDAELKNIENSIKNANDAISELQYRVSILSLDWNGIHEIVREGLATKFFHIGDQLIVPWKDAAADKTYEVPLDIVHFGKVTLKDGSVVPAMFLQWHYCTPFGVQFDHQENEQASESSFLSDYYYYEAYTASDGGTRYKLLVAGTDYAVGDSIPSSKVYYHSSIKDSTGYIVNYGYNRWSHSALRQFLNSAKGVNEWWTAQHLGDVAPEQLATKAGFMSGFDEEFLSCLKPIKVTTALNTVTDTEIGTTEDTYDTFFLPSLEQIYAKPQLAGVEGEIFDYWKQAVGKTAPNGWYDAEKNPAYITYALDAKTSAQSVRLRSASRGNSCNTWCQSSTGSIGGNDARGTGRFAPVCAIC